MKLHHVGIEVKDLYRVELFYRKALGFALRYRYVSRNTPGLRTVFLERDGVQLELLERPREDEFQARRAWAPNHLSLEVPDVDAEHARLAALGFPGVGGAAPAQHRRRVPGADPARPRGERDRALGPRRARAALSGPGGAVRPGRHPHRQRAELLPRRSRPARPPRPPVHRGGQAPVRRVQQPRADGRPKRRYGLVDETAALSAEKNELYLEYRREGDPALSGDEALLGLLAAGACRWPWPPARRRG